MTSLYFECSTGASGDMIVASLLDAGADKKVLQEALDSIPVGGFKTEISRVQKSGIDACDFNVILDKEHENHDHDMEYLYGHENHDEGHHFHDDHSHHDDGAHHHEHSQEATHHHHHEHSHEHRGLPEITQIINQTKMTDGAKALAHKIFDIIANAESKAHNKPKDQVHFHEVGAVDSIVDVIAAAVCFDNLGLRKVYLPSLSEGSGTVRTQHGVLPVPVPAVANIAAATALPIKITGLPGERVTPTGAAFLAAVATDKKLPETFTIKKIGIGAGKRAYEVPSLVRAFVIEEDDSATAGSPHHANATSESACGTANTTPATACETAVTPHHSDSHHPCGHDSDEGVWKLETNVDDTSGEALGYTMEQLFAAGARDVSFIPCFMKKNRPGTLINVICSKSKIADLEKIIFENTNTIGIRRVIMERSCLERKIESIQTDLGESRVKVVTLPDGTKRAYPEYEDVKLLAQKNGISFKQAFDKVNTEANRN